VFIDATVVVTSVTTERSATTCPLVTASMSVIKCEHRNGHHGFSVDSNCSFMPGKPDIFRIGTNPSCTHVTHLVIANGDNYAITLLLSNTSSTFLSQLLHLNYTKPSLAAVDDVNRDRK
jgi:hypothetical protein